MDLLLEQVTSMHIFFQFFLALILLIPIILISRTVVAGSRYSPILIIVIFGLIMGLVLVRSDVSTPGLPDIPIVVLMSKVTITALIASFFVGGQEIRKILKHQDTTLEDIIIPSQDEVILGTKRTQFVFLIRAFFILIGIEGVKRLVLGYAEDDVLGKFYPLIAYVGLVGSVILIDSKKNIPNKRKYITKGLLEIIGIFAVLIASHFIAQWIKPVIALPQIFFAMILSAALGMMLSKWRFGPSLRALLFAGIPVVLAANFVIGGSRIVEAFQLVQMRSVMLYGFFGQLFWMFGGIALLIYLGRANKVRNLAPGMAGSLSHSGLTGACTAGDLGPEAASRAPIMINVPFFGHIFVFSILAASAAKGYLMIQWAIPVVAVGILLTGWSLRTLRKAQGLEAAEVKGLMQFSLGWQLVAVFGSFLLLAISGMPLGDAAMATSSAISHFGLFAAIQGGMFGGQAADLIPFIFAMPFLIHPLVFGMFGKAADNDGVMPPKVAFFLGALGLAGVIYACFFA